MLHICNIKLIIITIINFGIESTRWIYSELDAVGSDDECKERPANMVAFIDKYHDRLIKYEKNNRGVLPKFPST